MVTFTTKNQSITIMAKITVKDTSVTIISVNENDYIPLNILEFGKVYTTRILNPSNSRGLKRKPD